MKKKVKRATIIRTAALVLAIINNALAIAGKSPLPFGDETVTEAISLALTVAAAITAWWKNNSFTQPAIEADERLENKNLRKI